MSDKELLKKDLERLQLVVLQAAIEMLLKEVEALKKRVISLESSRPM